MGTVDLGLNSGTAKTLGVLVIGFVIFHATDDVGGQLWSWVSATASNALNVNIGGAGGGSGLQLGA